MASPLRRRAKTTMTSKIRRNKKIKEIILETHEEISRLQKSIPLLKEEQLSTLIKQYLTHWEMIYSNLYDEEKEAYRPVYTQRQVEDVDFLFYISFKLKTIQDNIGNPSLYPPLEIAKNKSITLFLDFLIPEYADILAFGWDEYFKKYVKPKDDEAVYRFLKQNNTWKPIR